MDIQLVVILFIFGLLFVLEQFENKKENFAVIRKGYTNPSVLLEPGWAPLPYSINYGNKPRDFRNFGTFGSYPPNPICYSCGLGENAVTAPYLHANDLGDQSGELYGKVARSCGNVCGRNYADLGKPFTVAARSAGRVRQCRRLI
jgi:hypothetical protein